MYLVLVKICTPTICVGNIKILFYLCTERAIIIAPNTNIMVWLLEKKNTKPKKHNFYSKRHK